MRALNKSSEYEELYQNLGNTKDCLFDSMKDVFILAALLGATVEENKKTIKKKGGEAIKENIFNYDDKVIMDFIAVNATKDINILKHDKKEYDIKCELIEEYANKGMEMLSNVLSDDYLNVDKLINFVKEIDSNLTEVKKPSVEDILLGLVFEE